MDDEKRGVFPEMRSRRTRSLVAAGFGVFVLACGASSCSSASPASPTPSSPTTTVTSLAIVGPPVVLTGSSVTYSATATLSDGGGIRNVKPTAWRTDNASVATINGAGDGLGELTALGPGAATITATSQGASGTFSVQVRDAGQQNGGAHLAISFMPDPVPGSQLPCPGFPLPPPTWRYTELFAETQGVGFTVEMATLTLYDENGSLVYLSSEPEEYYFPPNSVFVEEGCISLFGAPSGFYADSLNGVDDRGAQLAFASSRLRLLPATGASARSHPMSNVPTTGGMVTRTLRRVR